MVGVVEEIEVSTGGTKNVRPLTGNEAIARGAWEAGVKVAAAYPGTPSTEILETLAEYPAEDLHAQWSTNEKVALDVAIGASFAGRRALAAMKHVGLNVAADAFMSINYIGVNGGLVLAVCDDPGIHSSQNEQDTRIYGVLSSVPVLEPSDAQEALEFTRLAFDMSETFDTPVIVRSTTRLSHTRSPVVLGDRTVPAQRAFIEKPSKNVMIPAHARPRHGLVIERETKAEGLSRRLADQPLGGRRYQLRRYHRRNLLPLCARSAARRQRVEARRVLAAAGRSAAPLLRIRRPHLRGRGTRAGDRKGNPRARISSRGQVLVPAHRRIVARTCARRIRKGRDPGAAAAAQYLDAGTAGAPAGALRRLPAHLELHGGARLRCARRRRYWLLHLGVPRSATWHGHHRVDGIVNRQCRWHGQGRRNQTGGRNHRRFDLPACGHPGADQRGL